MKNIPALLLLLLVCSVSGVTAQSTTSSKTSVFFQGTYDNFLREARQQKKIAVIDFFAAWSAPSKKMEHETFATPQFAAYVQEKFLIYRVNADTFGGMEIVNRFEVDTFPAVIVLDNHARVLEKWTNFQTVDQLIEKLKTVDQQSVNLSSL